MKYADAYLTIWRIPVILDKHISPVLRRLIGKFEKRRCIIANSMKRLNTKNMYEGIKISTWRYGADNNKFNT